jgi:inner membrane transporter RhtA
MKPHRRPVVDRIPAPALFITSGLTQYVGAAVAIGFFGMMPAASVAWWRIAASALVLLVWRRPWRQRWTSSTLRAAILFGVVLTTMNIAFYIALAHLPLGTSVAMEFLGPVGVAAVSGHGWRDRLGIVLAAAGVVALTGVTLSGGTGGGVVIGLVAIFATAVFWAGYILLGRRVAHSGDGVNSLAVGMTAGAIVYCPLAIGATVVVVGDIRHILAFLVIGTASSVIPYGLEQQVMRRVTAARFAIMLALLPLSATLVGAVVLGQIPGVIDILGMLAICAAIVLSARNRATGQNAAGERVIAERSDVPTAEDTTAG